MLPYGLCFLRRRLHESSDAVTARFLPAVSEQPAGHPDRVVSTRGSNVDPESVHVAEKTVITTSPADAWRASDTGSMFPNGNVPITNTGMIAFMPDERKRLGMSISCSVLS
jgi:hypothetical protein